MKTYILVQTRYRCYDGSICEHEYEGTIPELTQIFSYTLLCGNSRNMKINRNPKTIASLVNNINRSYHEKGEYNSSVRVKEG